MSCFVAASCVGMWMDGRRDGCWRTCNLRYVNYSTVCTYVRNDPPPPPQLTISHSLGWNGLNSRYSLFVVAVAIAVTCIVTREPPTKDDARSSYSSHPKPFDCAVIVCCCCCCCWWRGNWCELIQYCCCFVFTTLLYWINPHYFIRTYCTVQANTIPPVYFFFSSSRYVQYVRIGNIFVVVVSW